VCVPLIPKNQPKVIENMGVFTSIKKKEDKEDERTVPASEFIERLTRMQQKQEQQKDIPYTEMPKD
jgi:hypothetical protein